MTVFYTDRFPSGFYGGRTMLDACFLELFGSKFFRFLLVPTAFPFFVLAGSFFFSPGWSRLFKRWRELRAGKFRSWWMAWKDCTALPPPVSSNVVHAVAFPGLDLSSRDLWRFVRSSRTIISNRGPRPHGFWFSSERSDLTGIRPRSLFRPICLFMSE